MDRGILHTSQQSIATTKLIMIGNNLSKVNLSKVHLVQQRRTANRRVTSHVHSRVFHVQDTERMLEFPVSQLVIRGCMNECVESVPRFCRRDVTS